MGKYRKINSSNKTTGGIGIRRFDQQKQQNPIRFGNHGNNEESSKQSSNKYKQFLNTSEKSLKTILKSNHHGNSNKISSIKKKNKQKQKSELFKERK
jgi:hypothetical protein